MTDYLVYVITTAKWFCFAVSVMSGATVLILGITAFEECELSKFCKRILLYAVVIFAASLSIFCLIPPQEILIKMIGG